MHANCYVLGFSCQQVDVDVFDKHVPGGRLTIFHCFFLFLFVLVIQVSACKHSSKYFPKNRKLFWLLFVHLCDDGIAFFYEAVFGLRLYECNVSVYVYMRVCHCIRPTSRHRRSN